MPIGGEGGRVQLSNLPKARKGSLVGAFFHDQHKPVIRCRLFLMARSRPPILPNGRGFARCRTSSSIPSRRLRRRYRAPIPALSSETAGQLTKGTAAEPWARAAGAILGAAPSAWRDLPWARSVPHAGRTIEQELAALSERARQIHGALDEIAQSRRTTAILSTDGDTIVAGGKRDLDRVQKILVRPGERAAKLPAADAEITALSEAENAGLTPRALATTRPICSDCRAAIEKAGGVLTSRFTAVFPR
jgi:hypothetical protein